jgi:phenylacetate-CoA ligase
MAVYGSLPAPLKNVAASLRGWSLRRWRYGPDTERLVEEALERESWAPSRWKVWQEERIAVLLRRAAKRVPYYREQWAERRRAGDRASVENLQNWPILTKETIRTEPRKFLADDAEPRKMFRDYTSGTTGTPLTLFLSRETVHRWYALFECRVRNWNDVGRRDRWAILGGQLVTPVARKKPPFWVWNAASRQLYLSSYHLAPRNIPAYLDAIRRYRVSYVLGYASSLYSIAQVALERGMSVPSLRVAISNAEPFFRHQRDAVCEAFGCPARDTYGMAEIVCAASECASGSLHGWPEVGVVEVLGERTEEAVAGGETGRLICTGLLNPDMPLVRYETGDRGSLPEETGSCPCGRRLPLMRPVEGRSDDVLLTRDGRPVGRLDPVFKSQVGIREAQIIQEALERVRVKVVPAEGFDSTHVRGLTRALQDVLGADMAVVVETVEAIPRTRAGKFRAVVSRIQAGPVLPGVPEGAPETILSPE